MKGKDSMRTNIGWCILLLLWPHLLCSQDRDTIRIKGLHAAVEVLRDEWGVNHIYTANQHDLFFTQGYCAAKDRLFQFEIWRRQATGTVAEILGSRELKRDIGARLFRYRGNMQKEYQHYHPQGEQIIRAFTDGVNAYIREVLAAPEKLPAEFRLYNMTPGYWTPEVVVSRHASIMYNANQELSLARAVLRSDTMMVKELFWFHPQVPSLTMDRSITRQMLEKDILGLYTAFKREVSFTRGTNTSDVALHEHSPMTNAARVEGSSHASLDGSNNWIVSGAKSASGMPLLANDPHRRIAWPSLRYMVHLVAPGWNVTGAGEPTIPGISIGHNEHGAWGLTIAETDAEDIYVYDIDPRDPSRYRYRGGWKEMTTITDTIRVKDAAPQIVKLQYTVHGPVTFVDTTMGKAYALRCGWLEPGGAPYLASLRLDQARTWDEFREACSYGHMPGENMIWADKKGNTGWQVVGITPKRKGYSGYVPVPGDGRYEWDGFLPIRERPHMLNPEPGFLATANEMVTPNDYKYPQYVGASWSDPYRGNRIREVLGANRTFNLQDMAALQYDYLSVPARELVPLLAGIRLDKELENRAKLLLQQWDYKLEKNSIAASIYVMWERELAARARRYFVPDTLKPYINLQLSRIIEQLKKPRISFGAAKDLDRDALLKESFAAAVDALVRKLGPDMNSWQYGQPKFKHIQLQHSYLRDYTLGPIPRGGYGNTPGATSAVDNQNHGGSFKMVVDTRDWDRTMMINSPGQSADPNSPYFSNLFELWAEDKYFQAYFSRGKILASAEAVTWLMPLNLTGQQSNKEQTAK